MSICRKHDMEYHDSPVGVCPVCVRDERDRIQTIASQNAEQCRVWSEQHGKRMDQIAALEKERDKLWSELRRTNMQQAKDLQERDRLRHELREMTADRDSWLSECRSHADLVLEQGKEMDRLRDDCENLKHEVELENNAKCQIIASKTMEINRLRELIPQAWDAGALWASGMGSLGIEVCNNKEAWMVRKGLA